MPTNFSVLVTVVGHASRQWRGAANAKEADRLNMALSVQRAQSVRSVVEKIVKARIPNLPVEIVHKGVGSREPAPTPSEPNAAIDRSVMVTVDWTNKTTDNAWVRGPDRKVYTPSNIWVLRVVDLVEASVVGFKGSLITISIQNPHSGNALTMRGYLGGGDLDIAQLYKKIGKGGLKVDRKNLGNKQIGDDVSFETKDTMDFNDWINGDDGQRVQLVHTEAGFTLLPGYEKTNLLLLPNIDTTPPALPFQFNYTWYSLKPAMDFALVAGWVKAIEPNPGDYLTFPGDYTVVPVTSTWKQSDGVLVEFPTGESNFYKAYLDDQKSLVDYVTQRCLNIAARASKDQIQKG